MSRPAERGDRIGPWELLDPLGAGPTGAVWLARGGAGDAVAALKLLPPQASGSELFRLAREAALLEQLGAEGPGFVPLLGHGDSPAGPWLAMPLLAGALRARLLVGPLPVDEARQLIGAVAAALGRAHARGVVHRDLKPENVLLDEHGRPHVADLGLAKLLDSRALGLSRTGEERGTAGYAAPEQARDGKRVGPAADVFALGALLHECLGGQPAFLAANEAELLAQVAAGRPVTPLPREVPRRLRRVIARCLDPDPARRYADGAALAAALTGPAPVGPRVPAWTALLGCGACLLAGLALGAQARSPSWGGSAAPAGAGTSSAAASAAPARPGAGSPEIAPVVSSPPADARGWFTLAATREATGDRAGALALLDQALRAWPHDPALHEQRGQLRRRLNDAPGAAADLERAAELEPDQARRWNLLGVASEAAGQREAARQHYDRALELEPDFVRARVNRATLRRRMGDLEGAEADAREALRRDPQLASGQRALGHVLRARQREREAIEAFGRALELDPRDTESLEQRGYLLGRQGRFLEEVQDMTRLLELEPARPITWANRGWARLRLGDAEGAIPDFTRAIETAADPSAGWWHERARAHQALGHTAAARADYEEFLRRAPEDGRAAEARRQLVALGAR